MSLFRKVEPMFDWIVFEPEDPHSGIVLEAAQSTKLAKVIAVGPGRRTEAGELVPNSIKVGDYIIPGPESHMVETVAAGKKQWMIREAHLVGTIVPDPDRKENILEGKLIMSGIIPPIGQQ